MTNLEKHYQGATIEDFKKFEEAGCKECIYEGENCMQRLTNGGGNCFDGQIAWLESEVEE